MKVLEIVCLENGDVVLVEASNDADVDPDADAGAMDLGVVDLAQGHLEVGQIEVGKKPLGSNLGSDLDSDLDSVLDSKESPQTRADAEVAEQPLVTIRFSTEVRDMLGDDALGVAEAMIEAATVYISEEAESASGDFGGSYTGEHGAALSADRIEADLDDFDDQFSTAPVVLH